MHIGNLKNPKPDDISTGWNQRQLTRQEAIEYAESKNWMLLSDEELFYVGFFQELMCVPFSELHRVTEVVLGRPVWTHEFAFRDRLLDELRSKQKPTMEEIVDLIPEDKRIVVQC